MPSYNNPLEFYEQGTHTENGVNYSVSSQTGSLTKSWTNNPNYRALLESGAKLPTQTFTAIGIKHQYASGSFQFGPTSTFPTGSNSVSGVMWDHPVGQYCNWPVGHFGISTWDNQVSIDCDLAIRRKIKNQKVNLAQAFAERKQTASLLASSAIRITKAARSLKKGNFAGAFAALGYSPTKNQLYRLNKKRFSSSSKRYKSYNSQALAANWLEIQYGWKPLLGDVYGSAELLAKSLDRPRVALVVANCKLEKSHRDTQYRGYSDCLVITRDFRWKSEVKQTIRYNVTSAASRNLAELGISNPYHLAWELVPFSFVADWFTPIGAYLESIDALAGVSFVSGTRSAALRVDNRFIGNGRQNSGANGNWTYSGYGSGSYIANDVTRYPITGFPPNHTPSLQNPFSMTRVANAIALLRTIFR